MFTINPIYYLLIHNLLHSGKIHHHTCSEVWSPVYCYFKGIVMTMTVRIGAVSVPPAKRVACWAVPSQRRRLVVKTALIDPLALVHECSASRFLTRSRLSTPHSPVPRN